MTASNRPLRLIFMGTPAFAVPSLRALNDAGAYDIVAVVTQPDAPSGRGRALAVSPVKRLALERGLPVLQPERVRRPAGIAAIGDLQPDLLVVAAFGQMLPRTLLDIPPLGVLNVHASLLPRWRGAAPVAAAILAGDEESGVTIMLVDEGMDTGAILTQIATPILASDTTGSLTERLAGLGAGLLLDTLPRWARHEITPQPQDAALATLCKPIAKEAGHIAWEQPAAAIARAVRAYAPWPGAFTTWNGKTLKVHAAATLPAGQGAAEPGLVVEAAQGPAVVCGAGRLLLERVQMEGKRALDGQEFARGQRAFIGSRLG